MTTAEHLPVDPGMASLRRARESFLEGRRLPDGVPDEIVAAWKRARFFGVRHDAVRSDAVRYDVVQSDAVRSDDECGGVVPDGDGPGGSLPDESDLLAAARPVLERLAPAVGTGRTALLLTDERLRVLWATGRAPGEPYHEDLSEQVVGHNSAALALRTRRRAEVHGPEHFLDLWQDMSAVSVPVLGPETGRTVGTVTVTSELCAACSPHPWASLAEAAAGAVEAELLARSRPAERVLLDAYLRAARERGRAVVALDGRNRLVSEAAGRLLSPEGLEALERGVVALLREGEDAAAPASGGEPARGEALFGTGAASDAWRVRLPEDVRCSATVTPVSHRGAVIGAVAVLEPLRADAVAPVGRGGRAGQVDRGAVALAGSSVPWRHAVGRATELTRSPEPLLLVGERGTGKTALAHELAPDLLVVDAAEGELGSAVEALKEGNALLIRHAERLAQHDTATLNSLLEAHPGAPLLATYTPGAAPGPCLQRLLDTLAARSVSLPALRERPEDIRELLTALAPKPTPGQPPLTWTLDALRALERHPWPGNVTELVHVVRALAEQRRVSGPVRRAELPDHVREGAAARRLSPMELAERSAILEALRRNGGNKARTAAALGIARATLYRKLRGYRS